MITRSFMVQGEKDNLRDLFLLLLEEIDFTLVHREENDTMFRLIGASSKRKSQLVATMMNLFIGYIQRNRLAVELRASQNMDKVQVLLRCFYYMDVLDLEAPSVSVEEHKLASELFDLVFDRFSHDFTIIR